MKRIVLMWLLVFVGLSVVGTGSAWAQTGAPDRATLKFGPAAVAKAPASGLPRITGLSSIDAYVVQDFEGGVVPPAGWTLINPDTSYTWDTLSASSYGVGVMSAYVNNYDYSTAPAFDSLITPTITGLVATDSVKFDYAYTDYSPTFTDDSLFVDISTDNGVTWTSLWREGGAGLRTRPSTTSFFIPAPSEWATRSFLVPAGVVGANVKIAFVSRSNYGNNLFIDQVRIGTPPPPPLSGIKTIGGTSPDYPTVKAAIRDLNAVGTEPPGVTFLIRSGTYPEDSLRIRTATSSATAPIVFKPDVGATVVIDVAPPNTTYNFAIKIDTTQYVTIDGSNSGTTSRDMTINATGANGQRGVWVSGASHHATIKNCNITAGRDIASPTTSVRGIDFLYTGAAQNPNFVLAENNYIRHAYTGVRIEGNVAGDVMEAPVVRNNVIDSVGNAGIYTLYHNDALFSGNDVNVVRGSSATIYGIFVGSTTARTRVYANKVHDIIQRSTTSVTYGIYASGTSTLASHAIFNNFVWGISSPATATGAIYGIYDGVGNTTIADTIAYNTVNLTGSSTGNKTTAAFYKGSATGPAYVRNNVFQNTRTDGTTGVAVAIYKLGTTTVLNSNNNNLYPGTPDAQHVTGRISTTNYATIADWRTANSSDVASVAENSPFISGTDLHMQTGVPTQLESGGTPVAGISADIDNDARHATAPDIGADEFAGIALDLVPPAISYLPLGPTPQTTSRSLTATITDASGVPTAAIGLPVLYWRINSGSYTGAQGVFVSGSNYSFTFGAGVAVGDTVSYFVAAQDNATTPNVTVIPLAGASGFTANPPAASTPPTSPSSYRIVQPPLAAGDYTVGLTLFQKATGRKLIPQTHTRFVQKEVPAGPEIDLKSEGRNEASSSLTPFRQTALVEVEETYSVLMENGRPYSGPTRVELSSAQKGELGLPDYVLAIYPTLTAAVADLNLRGVAGSVRLLLVDTTYTGETFPITVNVIGDSVPTASKTVTIKPSTGITATISGASASGRILQVVNTSFVTIDGSNTNGGTTRDLTLQNTSITSPSVLLFGSMGTTPITDCTLKNTIVINGVNSSTPVIVSDAVAGNAGYFSNITIQNNAIRNGYHALYCNAVVAALNGANLLVAFNTIGSTATDSVRFDGVYIQGADGAIVRGNDIGGFSTVTSEVDRGVWLATGTKNTLVEGNTIHDMNYGGTAGYGGKGVVVSSGLANCNNTVQNNMIFNLTGDSDSYTSFGATYSPSGVYAFGAGQTGVNIFYNSIYMYGNTINNDAQCYSIGIALDDGTAASVLNNVIVNNLGLLASTGVGPVAIAAEVSNTQFTAINYNDYYTNAGPPAVNNIGKIGASDFATLPLWAAASGGDLQSMSVNANFLSATNLHIDTTQATSLDGGAVTIAGVTTDFDGQTRHATTPDIGADEFTIPVGPLAGTYRIGVSGDYATLSLAVADLQTLGVSAPVTFLFLDASYVDTAQIIGGYPGQSETNTVTFRPSVGVTTRILFSGGTSTFGVRMDSVSGIVWDGSNSGGTDRSMTIESDTNTTTARTPFFVRKGSRNVTLKNMIIKGNRHSAGGIPSVVVIDNTGFAASGGQHNITVNNCQLMRGNNGLFVNAASGAVRDSNHTFTNNLIGGENSASIFDHLAAAGISMTGNHNVLVQGNDVNGIKVAGTAVGIRVNGANTATVVNGNRIHNLVTTSGAFRPLCILVGNIIATGPAVRTRATISNNMIYDIHNFGAGVSGRAVDGLIYNPTGGVNSPNGNGSTIDWYYNSWNINYAAGEGGTTTAFFFDGNFAGSNPTAGHSDSIRFYNNVGSFMRADSLAARMFLLLQEVTPGNFAMQSDNNVYNYITGPFAQVQSPFPGGTTVAFPATLEAFRDSTRLDSNSVFGNPQFVSALDAHISTTLPTPVEGNGRPIAGITVDFDGNTRNATVPDIGADEGTFISMGNHDIGVASLSAASGPQDAGLGSVGLHQKAVSFPGASQTQAAMALEVIPDERELDATGANMVSAAYAPAENAIASTVTNEVRVPEMSETTDGASAGSITTTGSGVIGLKPGIDFTFNALADTVRFQALVQNFGGFVEPSYMVGWSIDGVTQATIPNVNPLEVGDTDTLSFQWNAAVAGQHTARAWTILAPDANPANDSASTTFSVGPNPGDTLYTFIVPGQIILGVSKMGPSNKLAFTSGGQSSAVTTDNKWIVTNLRGTILDTTHLQINPTTGQGFGFRDLAWDGRWLLTADNNQVRRIDTTTFTEIATRITGPGSLQRGLAADGRNRIWKSDFTTSPVILFDTTGAIVKQLPIPAVAPYGIAIDKWTDPNRMWLWYSEPSTTGQPVRLSKVDTANGAIVQTFNYGVIAGTAISGGLDIVNNHPDYPGRVVAFLVGQRFPTSIVLVIDLGPDMSVPEPTPGWTNQTSGVTTALSSTAQVNSSVAWAAGNGGVVVRTTNGGLSWSSVGGGAIGTADLYAIEAISATTAFTTASTTTTYLFRTTNAGATWDTVYTQPGGFLNAIHMFDATNGIAVGDPVGGLWTVIRTSNGGASWARIATEPTQVASEFGANNGLAVVGNTHIWFSPGTTTGRVYRSTDGGATWASSVLPFLQFTAGLAFSNTQYGVAGGSGGAAARTTDGGATWTSVTLPASGTVYGIAAANSEFFATRGSAIYRSTDRGATWASSYAGGVGALNHISAATSGSSAYLKAVSATGGIASGFFTVTGIEEQHPDLPAEFALMQNYPNPFNPTTTIRYALPTDAFVTLKVYNILGQEVATLREQLQNVGFHDIVWNGRNNAGQNVSSGVYFYRLEGKPLDGSGVFTSFKKMLMLK